MLLRSVSIRGALATALLLCGVVGAHAMSVIAPTFDQLVGAATTVVRGVVTDVHCVSVDTPQGTAIQTLVTFHVERVLKGNANADLTLNFLGGKLGARTLTVLGMPTFKVGDREIVFVGDNGHAICPVLAAGYGRYHVRHDRATNRDYVARENNSPLASTDQIVQALDATNPAAPVGPGDAMTTEAFESRIVAAVHGNPQTLQP